MGRLSLLLAALAVALLAPAAPAGAFDPGREARNYSKINERFATQQANGDYQLNQLAIGLANMQDLIQRDVGAGGKRFSLTLCASGFQGCAGDIRAYDYQGRKGLQIPFVFVNRNGAHLEGHVWLSFRTLARYDASLHPSVALVRRCRTLRQGARGGHRRHARRHRRRRAPAFTGRVHRRFGGVRRGGARRRCTQQRVVQPARPLSFPGVVLQTGSIQAPERLYWWAAQTLAAHDYVVLTFDVQGQGRSDTFGFGPQTLAGVPAQDARVFIGDLEDAIDFFDSSPGSPFSPRGAVGAQRQRDEVAARAATAFNPLHALLDRGRLGIVGHSLGAYSVSYMQGVDPRVDAVVAWDNLSSATVQPGSPPSRPRVPALGMSADYYLTPTPYTSDPNPEAKNGGFAAWRRAGLDSMELTVRGGTHYEWSYISNPAFGASLRGIDMAGWYTTAWFDKYVKGDPTADRRLLSGRWRADALEAAVDPDRDGNMLSFYYRSRAAFHRADGSLVTCDDLRAGCPALMVQDGEPTSPPYSVLGDR
jgi:alpha-beta hydrolase superfamily lysophospholipase